MIRLDNETLILIDLLLVQNGGVCQQVNNEHGTPKDATRLLAVPPNPNVNLVGYNIFYAKSRSTLDNK